MTLILCPLPMELENLLTHLRGLRHPVVEEQVGPLKVFQIADLGWRLSLAGHGKAQFALQTQFLLQKFPDTAAVICAGCAGSLQPELAMGDVVAAEVTVEHDYRLRFVQKPLPEFAAAPGLLARIRQAPASGFKVHFGRIASGDEDVVEAERAKEIRDATQALAVAWEGAGAARACKFSRVPFLEIRGITDQADSAAPANFAKNLKVAMANVASLCLAGLV